jgi:hypothetical protein
VKTRVVNVRYEKCEIYCGRGSKLGNPFTHSSLANTKALYQVATRDEAVDCHHLWFLAQPELMACLPELKGHVLGCYCKPERCHCDTIAALADLT